MSSLLRTIAIVGGGFSGTVVAVGLLRAAATPLRIVLIERESQPGRGVAYAQRSFPYLLNVPAGRMSANLADPDEFLTFARARLPQAQSEDFLPRHLYGDYLQELLFAAKAAASDGVHLHIVRAAVTSIVREDSTSALQLTLSDGQRIRADDVVLALGNPPPASPGCMAAVIGHPAYVRDPWDAPLRFSRRQQVLVIGTGLTAADVINQASSDPTSMPVLHAMSRHALVPPRQSTFHVEALQADVREQLLASAYSLRGLTQGVRRLAEQAQRDGGDWREVITAVRGCAPALWQRLTLPERQRFLRHLRTYWDVHRHRLPPQISDRILQLHERGRLHFHAGRLLECRPREQRIEVVWQPRGSGQFQARTFDQVINCTGPDYRVTHSREPLWRSLLEGGLCVPDALGLGIRTGAHGAVIDGSGRAASHLFYVGPMLRADHWEATAVHELRGHALSLVQRLLRPGA